MVDGVVRKVGLDGELIEEPPMVPLQPLHPVMSLREQALAEEAERAIGLDQYAEEGRARERGRQRLNAEALERAEAFEREQLRLRSGELSGAAK